MTIRIPQLRLWAGLGALWLAALGSACGRDPAAPTPGDPGPGLSGSYVLDVPRVVFDDLVADPEGDFRLRIVATGGSLALAADSTYQQEVHLEAYVDEALAGSSRWVDRGEWRIRSDTLRFDSGYLEGVAFHGLPHDWGVALHQDLAGEGTTVDYAYRRAALD